MVTCVLMPLYDNNNHLPPHNVHQWQPIGTKHPRTDVSSLLNRSAETWKKAFDLAAKELTAMPNDPAKQMDLAYAYFSLLNGSLATPNDDLFNEYISDGKKNLEKKLSKTTPNRVKI